jgi:SAM-dependent methyltransferase
MEPYTVIAPYYDVLLRHVDYQEWYEYLRAVMERHAARHETILELGCGTGRFGAKFSNDGYTIFGADRSLEMLRVARSRAFMNFRIFCADITGFRLAQPVDFIFSVHDTVNYLLEYSDIINMFRCVRDIMHGESVFMFDITTEHNIYKNFDGKTSKSLVRNGSVEWSNRYDARKKLITSTLNLNRAGESSVEEHVQRIYDAGEIRGLLKEAGLAVWEVYGDYTFDPPRENTIMINFITGRA